MKYNDNGTIKEVKVKAFDTLPVGAIVEYSGSTIPSGWIDIGNNKIQKTSQYIEGGAGLPSYFTDEIDTGMKWIDGKPIYRKVIKSSFDTQTADDVRKDINVATMNIKKIINFGGFIDYINEPPVVSQYGYYTFFTSTNIIRVYNNLSAYLNSDFYLIIEYTKTTD